MSECGACGAITALIIKTEDGFLCSECFTQTSPMIDEGIRILEKVMANLEWEYGVYEK